MDAAIEDLIDYLQSRNYDINDVITCIREWRKKKICESQAESLQDFFTQKVEGGRYAVLEMYFDRLFQLDELKQYTEGELIGYVEPRHKLLMSLFVRRHLDRFLRHEDYCRSPDRKLVLEIVDGVLDLSKKVHADSKLKDVEQKLENVAVEKIKVINLSDNFLRDADMSTVYDIVKRCPNCHTVVLSSNMFRNCDEYLFQILNLSYVKYVDITMNGMATVERKYLFSEMSAKNLDKLIWIPQQWVHRENAGWRSMVCEFDIQRVENTHDVYYSGFAYFGDGCLALKAAI